MVQRIQKNLFECFQPHITCFTLDRMNYGILWCEKLLCRLVTPLMMYFVRCIFAQLHNTTGTFRLPYRLLSVVSHNIVNPLMKLCVRNPFSTNEPVFNERICSLWLSCFSMNFRNTLHTFLVQILYGSLSFRFCIRPTPWKRRKHKCSKIYSVT